MLSRKFKKTGLGVAVAALVAVLFGSVIAGAAEPIRQAVSDLREAQISASADEADWAVLNSNYSAFADGATYTFTDKDKYAAYNGDETYNTDTTTITVSRTNSHGTQRNPYVIDSFARWRSFMNEMGDTHSTDSSWTYGAGKYYVLAVDLDFSSSDPDCPSTLVPMWSFAGTLYGLGHSLTNYNMTDTIASPTGNYQYFGMFRFTWNLTGAVAITDLNLQYRYTNADILCGGFFGYAAGNSSLYILNCHVIGTLSRATARSMACISGGFIGINQSENSAGPSNVYIYRCSMKYNYNVIENTGVTNQSAFCGGFVGACWARANTYFTDCVSDVKYNSNFTSGTCSNLAGALIGYCNYATSNTFQYHGGIVSAIRCLTRLDATANLGLVHFGQLFTCGQGVAAAKNVTIQATTYTVQDCYSYGQFTVPFASADGGMGKWILWPWWQYNSSATTTASPYGYVNCNNMNYTGSYNSQNGDGYDEWHWGIRGNCSSSGTRYNGTEGSFWDRAKAETAYKEKIWVNKEAIRNFYETDASDMEFTQDYIPQKSAHVDTLYHIRYYNFVKTGTNYTREVDQPIDVADPDDNYTYRYSADASGVGTISLDRQTTQSGLTLRGWTRNKNWKAGDPTTWDYTPPAGMNGDITYYAVWEATGITATISAQDGKTQGEYGESLVMEASVTTPTISKPSVTYRWMKGTEKVSEGTRSTYSITEFGQSGTYSFEYTLSDPAMPLVYASGSSSNSVNFEITAKSVKVRNFEITSENVFAGMELKDLEFDVTMIDGDNRVVPGTAKWEREIDKVVEGENTVNIKFTPTDTGNYSPVTVPVTFTAAAIKLTFHMSQVSSTIEATLDYDQNYTSAMLLKVFQDAFAEKLENDSAFAASVSGRAPMLDGKELDAFDTTFNNVTENKSITVTFVTRSYTVTLDKNDGSENPTETKTLSWNYLVTEPTVERNGYELLGWYYRNDANLEVKWDFDSDRVTKNITLTAKWKALNLTLINIDASNARLGAYTALDAVKDEDLNVVATYRTDDGDTVTSVIHLGGDGYTIQYNGSDHELHYGTTGDYTITVSYRYKGITATTYTTETDTVTLTVAKIEIDTSKLTFPAKSVEVSQTGGSAKIDAISATALSALPGSPTVTYRYTRTDGSSDPSWTSASGIPATSANIGEYFAYADFATTSDYNAPSIRTTLKIRAQLVPVRVDWGTFGDATYDGTDKRPTTIQVYRTDTNTPLNMGTGPLEYRVMGSENNETFISAGTHTMTIVLGEDLKFTSTSGQTTKNLTIKKKTLNKPTLDSSYSFTYNGEQYSIEDYVLYDDDRNQFTLSGQFATNAGDYTLTVALADAANYQWSGTSAPTFTLRWSVKRMSVAAPTLSGDSIEYDGAEHSITELFSGNDFKDAYMGLELTYRAINASPTSGYRARVKLTDTVNYQWDGAQTTEFVWRITKKVVSKPTFDGAIELDYLGEQQNVAYQISNYDSAVMKLSTNATQRNAGTYTSTLSLVDSNNYVWDDGTSTAVQVKWVINKVTASPVWESQDTYTQDGGRHSPKIIDFTGLVGTDIFNQTSDISYGGKSNQTAVGGYITEATVKASWGSNYTIDTAEMKKGYRIIRAGETGDTTDVQIPDTGNGSGGNTGDGSGGGSGNQGGDNPGGNGSGGNGSGGTIGDNSGGNIFASGLPIIQLIISGIAIILTVVFVCCTLSDASRCKRAKQKVATMSVAPFALLAPFLGVASGGWWGIAGACVVLCIISLALMLVFKNKRRAAEGVLADKVAEAKEEAQRRRDEEKEEAQRRRDDDFKMMMASMMNRPMPESSGPSGFDVQALLTGMQESMGNMITALLPATTAANQANNGESETVKLLLAQNSEMMDRLNNQPAADTSASDERIRELEERLARQQQEQAALQQQREDEMRRQQQEMMMRQEELIKKLMERDSNPPVAGGVGSNTTNSFVYEVEEEKLSIDRLTLAEAYEALTANSKKLFDAIGEYVMAKPETAESDGKYAISFKYRAKALFKLVIKRGIPTIAYSTEGEQLRQLKRDAASEDGVKVRFRLNELQVLDSSTLEIAKGVVDLRIEQIDKDIEYVKAQKAAKKKANRLS